jgi:hypothetical protein
VVRSTIDDIQRFLRESTTPGHRAFKNASPAMWIGLGLLLLGAALFRKVGDLVSHR